MSPYQVIFGKPPPNMLAYTLGSTPNEAVDAELRNREHILATVRTHLLRSQQHMKTLVDKKRKDHTFEVGDKALLRLQPYRQLSVQRRSSHKLNLRYYGPFSVLERIGKVAYRLDLPPLSRIHNVFHISLLRPFRSDTPVVVHPLPASSTDSVLLHKPCAILDSRVVWRNNTKVPQLLVQWEGLLPEDASWEDEADIRDNSTTLPGLPPPSMETSLPRALHPTQTHQQPSDSFPISNTQPHTTELSEQSSGPNNTPLNTQQIPTVDTSTNLTNPTILIPPDTPTESHIPTSITTDPISTVHYPTNPPNPTVLPTECLPAGHPSIQFPTTQNAPYPLTTASQATLSPSANPPNLEPNSSAHLEDKVVFPPGREVTAHNIHRPTRVVN